MELKIIHVDMDAFYASVEQLDDPTLQGKPVIVGGAVEKRGVVSAASYEARRFGVHSAMPMGEAKRRCPQAVILPVRMTRYAEVSKKIQSIFRRYTPLVQPLSLDEAYLDTTGCERLFGNSVTIGRRIKKEIKSETRLTASVGIAPNKFLAKLASDNDKPDGFTVVDPDRIMEFLKPLPVERLIGVGPSAVKQLHRWGIRTVEQLQMLPLNDLESRFGEWGVALYHLARGEDHSQVTPQRNAKSISAETTFAEDVSDSRHLKSCLYGLVEKIGRRLRRSELVGRTVLLKIRWPNFKLMTRHLTLPFPTNLDEEIFAAAWHLLESNQVLGRKVRLMGVGLKGFERESESMQSWLFTPLDEKRRLLAKTQDRLKDKYGEQTIRHGRTLLGNAKE